MSSVSEFTGKKKKYPDDLILLLWFWSSHPMDTLLLKDCNKGSADDRIIKYVQIHGEASVWYGTALLSVLLIGEWLYLYCHCSINHTPIGRLYAHADCNSLLNALNSVIVLVPVFWPTPGSDFHTTVDPAIEVPHKDSRGFHTGGMCYFL